MGWGQPVLAWSLLRVPCKVHGFCLRCVVAFLLPNDPLSGDVPSRCWRNCSVEGVQEEAWGSRASCCEGFFDSLRWAPGLSPNLRCFQNSFLWGYDVSPLKAPWNAGGAVLGTWCGPDDLSRDGSRLHPYQLEPHLWFFSHKAVPVAEEFKCCLPKPTSLVWSQKP